MKEIRKDIVLFAFIFLLIPVSLLTEGVFKAMALGGIVGSVIGWSTNWAVIQMLFRPRLPKKILGITWAGLLIKKKPELARKIGEVVEQDLLTKEKIIEKVDAIKPIIHTKIEERISEICETDLGTIKEISGSEFFPALEDARRKIVKDISPVIEKNLFSKDSLNWITGEIINMLRYYANTPLVYVIGTENIDSAIKYGLELFKSMDKDKKEKLMLEVSDYLYEQILMHRSDFDIKLKEALACGDVSFLETVSEEILAFVSKWISKSDNQYIIRNNIKPILEKISHSFEESNGFVSYFIDIKQKIEDSIDNHWETIIDAICHKLSQKDTANLLSGKIKDLFPILVEKADISGFIKSDTFKELFESLLLSTGPKIVQMADSDEFLKKLRVKAYIMLERPFCQIVPDWEKKAEKILLNAANNYVDMISTSRRSPVKDILENMSSKAVVSFKIGKIGDRVSQNNKDAAVNEITDVVFRWIKENIPSIIDNNICIGKMVESEIKDFSNEELEKTVKAVADDELGTIIRLGGYLGIAAGAVSQLLIFIVG